MNPTPDDVYVRRATVRDAGAVRNLLEQRGYTATVEEIAERIREATRSRQAFLAVATSGDATLELVAANRSGQITTLSDRDGCGVACQHLVYDVGSDLWPCARRVTGPSRSTRPPLLRAFYKNLRPIRYSARDRWD